MYFCTPQTFIQSVPKKCTPFLKAYISYEYACISKHVCCILLEILFSFFPQNFIILHWKVNSLHKLNEWGWKNTCLQINKLLFKHLFRKRVFIVLNYQETKIYEIVPRNFEQNFPQRISPTKKTIKRTLQKFKEHETTLNRNKENSGRERTGRTQEDVEMVQNVVDENPR